MASKSETFLEIGECTNKDEGSWGKRYYGGDNQSNYPLASGSSGGAEKTTKKLFRLKSWSRSFYREGDFTGDSRQHGDAKVMPYTIVFECNNTPVSLLIKSFFGEGNANLINFHIHQFKDYTHDPAAKRKKTHVRTVSGWQGRIMNVQHRVGEGGDEMVLTLAADRFEDIIWVSARNAGGKVQNTFSHASAASASKGRPR